MTSRRQFISLLGGAATAWPGVARGEQPEQIHTVGILLGSTDNPEMRRIFDAFMETFKKLGWTENRNVRFSIRWSGGNSRDNAIQAKELVRQRPDVIFAAPSNAVIALQKETHSIPIVFAFVSDPIAQGIVDSLARPTGNLTGFSNLEPSLMGKWLQILKEASPGLRRAALMISTVNAASPIWYRLFKEAASTLELEPISTPIRHGNEVENAVKLIAAEPHTALIVPGDTMLSDPPVRKMIVDLAAMNRLPAIYGQVVFVHDGGMIAYGIDRFDPFQRAASYVDRNLRGAIPADLPVQQPTKFRYVINLKTAKALGIDLPATILIRADEVIE